VGNEFALVDVAGVDVVTTGPGQGLKGRFVRSRGDLADRLAPMIVREFVGQLALPYARERRRLFAVDSVQPLATPVDVVWGGGAAGDPLLLLAGVRPSLVVQPEERSGVVIAAELTLPTGRRRRDVLDAAGPLDRVLRRIAGSELVVTASPAVLLTAEALGVPARAVVAEDEPPAALVAHYAATGRDAAQAFSSTVEEAIEAGGMPAPWWDPHPLVDAFPARMWGEHGDPTILAAIGWRARLGITAGGEPPPIRLET
jgi:pyruvyltransferase